MSHKYPIRRQKVDGRDHQKFGGIIVNPQAVLPKTVDLRPMMPPVFDQGQEGSCTANAGCTAVSIALGQPELILSRQFQYGNERVIEGNFSQDGGAEMRDIGKAACKYGICEESYMPYTQANLFAHPTQIALTNGLTHKPTSYKSLANLNEIKQYLATEQKPVLVGFDVYESFESDEIARTGIMSVPKKGEQLLGGHAVLFVGYIDGEGNVSLTEEEAASSTPKQIKDLQDRVTKLEKIVVELTQVVANIVNPPQPTPGPTPNPVPPTPTPVPPTPDPVPPTPAPVDPVDGYAIVRNSWGEKWGQKGYFLMPYEVILSGLAYDFWVIE